MLATLRYMDKGKNLPGLNPFTSALLTCMKLKVTAGVFGHQFHPAPAYPGPRCSTPSSLQDMPGDACGLQFVVKH